MKLKADHESFAALLAESRAQIPIALNMEQRRAVTQWAEDGRLWTTPEDVAFNLHIFARVILAANR